MARDYKGPGNQDGTMVCYKISEDEDAEVNSERPKEEIEGDVIYGGVYGCLVSEDSGNKRYAHKCGV